MGNFNKKLIKSDGWILLPEQRGGPLGPGTPGFPIQPLRPLPFLATGPLPQIPPTISPVNHPQLNDLINNREGSPTPTEGMKPFFTLIRGHP